MKLICYLMREKVRWSKLARMRRSRKWPRCFPLNAGLGVHAPATSCSTFILIWPPAFRERTPQLADPLCRDLEPAGSRARGLALGEELGDATITAIERGQPVAEVDAGARDVGGTGAAIFDENLFPDVFGRIEMVETLDGQTFVALTILAQDIQDIEVPACLAAVAGLLDALAGESAGVSDVGLAELDEAGVIGPI